LIGGVLPPDNSGTGSGGQWKGARQDQEEAMLVFSRTTGESLMVGDEIEVQIVEIRGDKVRLGIVCSKDTSVHRKEIYDALQRGQQPAEEAGAPPPRDEE
jgi:carbon storage regulator